MVNEAYKKNAELRRRLVESLPTDLRDRLLGSMTFSTEPDYTANLIHQVLQASVAGEMCYQQMLEVLAEHLCKQVNTLHHKLHEIHSMYPRTTIVRTGGMELQPDGSIHFEEGSDDSTPKA
jgi:hypothetical protein